MEESDPSEGDDLSEDDDLVKRGGEKITEMEEDDPSENDNHNFSETEECKLKSLRKFT